MTKGFSLKPFLNSDKIIIFNFDIKLSENNMVFKLEKGTYQVTKINCQTLKVVISNKELDIEFTRITDGWISTHQRWDDPIFPSSDVWKILDVLDFLYILKNQLN